MKPYAQTHIVIPVPGQRGFSLIELMISMTIGMILLVAFTALIVHQSSARDELEKSSRQIENGRYAMQLLHDDIEHAGYFGLYSPDSSVAAALPADPCAIAFGAANSGWDTSPVTVPVPLYGYLGAATNPLAGSSCNLTAYMPNTAILVVRRVTTTPLTVPNPATPSFTAGTYLQASGCNNDTAPFTYATGAASFPLRKKDCVTQSMVSPYIVNIYYISSCDVCGTDNIPTLKMVQVGPTTVPSTIPLVEGIENMQFDYGVDNSGDGAPDTFVAAQSPNDVADWQNVMAVRVSLLARNIDQTTSYTDNKTYNLGTAGTVACGTGTNPQPCNYKRHLYSEEIRLINPSGRREAP